MSLLEIKKLEKRFSGIRAVRDCDFVVNENEIVALIGPNGAGKTTVFNIISGFIKQDSGHIHFKGEPISELEVHERALLGIARTFQLTRLFANLTAVDNLLIAKGSEGHRLSKIFLNLRLIGHERDVNRKRCLDLLRIVGLEEKKEELAKNLSFGQQKLLEIARALATEADLLLLDEPVAGVNPVMRQKIREVLLKLKKEGKTILFIEHDMKFVMGLADKIVVMDSGEEIAVGKPEQIQKNKKVLRAYLGKKIDIKKGGKRA